MQLKVRFHSPLMTFLVFNNSPIRQHRHKALPWSWNILWVGAIWRGSGVPGRNGPECDGAGEGTLRGHTEVVARSTWGCQQADSGHSRGMIWIMWEAGLKAKCHLEILVPRWVLVWMSKLVLMTPCYCHELTKKKDKMTKPGWLVCPARRGVCYMKAWIRHGAGFQTETVEEGLTSEGPHSARQNIGTEHRHFHWFCGCTWLHL